MLEGAYSVAMKAIIKAQNLDVVYLPRDASEIIVSNAEVNRPGLQLAGFFDYFDRHRIQIIGKSELAYLGRLEEEQITESLNNFFEKKPVAVVVSWGNAVSDKMLSAAIKHEVPLFSTEIGTSEFMSALIAMLNVELAPRFRNHQRKRSRRRIGRRSDVRLLRHDFGRSHICLTKTPP